MQNWPVPKKRDTNYNVALRSSPGANKSFKDRGNDFGNGPISIEPRRCLEKSDTVRRSSLLIVVRSKRSSSRPRVNGRCN